MVSFGIDSLPIAVRTFATNHPDAASMCGDISEWPPDRLRSAVGIAGKDVDLIVGGPPCQGFSSIRPHRSSAAEDDRNGLYRHFVEYVDYFRPRAFVMENVVGLATHRGGATLASIEAAIRKIGYVVDWRILNSADFGVPQRRERLIMIGTSASGDVPFPRPSHRSSGSTIGHRDKSRVIGSAPTLYETRKLPRALTAWDAISDLPPVEAGQEATSYDLPPQNDYQSRLRVGSLSLSLHRATAHSARMLEIIRHSGPNRFHLPPGMVKSGFSTSYSRIDPNTPCVTLTVNFVFPPSNKCIHPFQDRALTPREGARIQSFPDSFAFSGNWSQIVKQIGNAVPPLLGEAIGQSVAPLVGLRLAEPQAA
ncbi:MAG: DNA cytosine methyltransferase [Thermoplasmata archaeon]